MKITKENIEGLMRGKEIHWTPAHLHHAFTAAGSPVAPTFDEAAATRPSTRFHCGGIPGMPTFEEAAGSVFPAVSTVEEVAARAGIRDEAVAAAPAISTVEEAAAPAGGSMAVFLVPPATVFDPTT
jgi:hypothetical protein